MRQKGPKKSLVQSERSCVALRRAFPSNRTLRNDFLEYTIGALLSFVNLGFTGDLNEAFWLRGIVGLCLRLHHGPTI
jgi:hypothetical protein